MTTTVVQPQLDPEALAAFFRQVAERLRPMVEAFREMARRVLEAARTWWPLIQRLVRAVQGPPPRQLRQARRDERRRLRRMIPAHRR